MKQNNSTRGKILGKSVIYGKDGEHQTPYMTRYFFGRLRFHVFHRPDQDPDCHNHPWGFWTFPLTSYVEEVATPWELTEGTDGLLRPTKYVLHQNIVRAWRLHYRPADYTHRVLGAWTGDWSMHPLGFMIEDPTVDLSKPIRTFVLRDRWTEKSWGFLKNRDGKWCWSNFKDYVFGDGKNAPCS